MTCDFYRPICDRPAAGRRAFTLVELMVVIAIIVIVLVVGLPAIGTLFTSGRLTNAERSVSSTVAAARAYAARPIYIEGGSYQGAAALFLTDNTVRIVQHTENFGSDLPEFTDVQDPLYLPEGIKAVAISRGGSSGTPKLYLVRPPFSVRFDRNGMMIVRRYSSNPETSVHHREVNGDDSDLDNTKYDGNNGDGVDSVLGLILFNTDDAADELTQTEMDSLDDFLDSTKSTTELDSGNAYDWVLANGIPMLFNRYSGAVMKGEQR